MKKTFILAMMALSMSTMANAQSLLDGLKGVASSAVKQATGSDALGNIVGTLLGTSKVTEASLEGTWTYTQPCIAFESKNVLATVGSTAVASKAQDYLNKGLTKAGITAGKMSVTFTKDKKVSVAINGKTSAKGTYTVNGSDLTLTVGLPNVATKSVKLNCKISGGELQIAANSQKILTLVQSISTKASSANTTMSTLASLTKSVDGMYMGLQFKK